MQVLSKTVVSQALKFDECNDEIEKTAQFFDCLNVRCTQEYRKRNPDVSPYTTKEDK